MLPGWGTLPAVVSAATDPIPPVQASLCHHAASPLLLTKLNSAGITVPCLTDGVAALPSSTAELVTKLTATSEPELLPDTDFKKTTAIISVTSNHRQVFAEALAGFLTDPHFHCNRPVLDRYFRLRFQAPPANDICPPLIPFRVAQRYSLPQQLWINPARVSEVRILFGGKGQKMASKFGHLALHIVVCPEDSQDPQACDSNLFEHLVVGFMAHIDEFELSTFKALWGDYHAYLFAFRFMDIYQDYAINEFREIYSLPIHLSPEERTRVLRELSEIHWAFQGEYRFFSKNCASLLQQALWTLLPAFKTDKYVSKKFIRPDRLFNAFKRSGLTNGSALAPKQAAEKKGYYFSSTKPFYAKAFSVVHGAMAKPPFSNLDEYLLMTPPARRAAWADDKAYLNKLLNEPYLLEAQQLLEELALVRSERRFHAEGSRYLQRLDVIKRKQDILKQLDTEQAALFNDCILMPVSLFTRPVQRFPAIPSEATNHEEDNQRVLSCRTPERQKRVTELLKKLGTTARKPWERLINSSEIVEITLENVRLLKDIRPVVQASDNKGPQP
ncbi:MAG: DUF4105 domain-containing protein [Geobacteraceae bacterium]|nr:DUF4105 domain-containing protein [Geobacteraceae bacterium]